MAHEETPQLLYSVEKNLRSQGVKESLRLRRKEVKGSSAPPRNLRENLKKNLKKKYFQERENHPGRFISKESRSRGVFAPPAQGDQGSSAPPRNLRENLKKNLKTKFFQEREIYILVVNVSKESRSQGVFAPPAQGEDFVRFSIRFL